MTLDVVVKSAPLREKLAQQPASELTALRMEHTFRRGSSDLRRSLCCFAEALRSVPAYFPRLGERCLRHRDEHLPQHPPLLTWSLCLCALQLRLSFPFCAAMSAPVATPDLVDAAAEALEGTHLDAASPPSDADIASLADTVSDATLHPWTAPVRGSPPWDQPLNGKELMAIREQEGPACKFWGMQLTDALRVVPVCMAFDDFEQGGMVGRTNPTHFGNNSNMHVVFFGAIEGGVGVSMYGTVHARTSIADLLHWYSHHFSNLVPRMYLQSKHSYGCERSYTVLITYANHDDNADWVQVPRDNRTDADFGAAVPPLVTFDPVSNTFHFRPSQSDYGSGRKKHEKVILNLAFEMPPPSTGWSIPLHLFQYEFKCKKLTQISYRTTRHHPKPLKQLS